MMSCQGNITFILGGTRSGKSAYAESLIPQEVSHRVLYAATAEVWEGDGSMQERIVRHQARRPGHWRTLEAPRNLANLVGEELARESYDTVMVDCLTLLISNAVCGSEGKGWEPLLEKEIATLVALMKESSCRWVLVSGETGLGGVPGSRMERDFCDALGMVNQAVASVADRTVLVVAGKTLELK